MTHAQDHGVSNRQRLLLALAITGLVFVVQLVGAFLTGSLALLADSGHMFSDLAGLGIALLATSIALKPATERATFGFQRAEVFGALINGTVLVVVAVVVGIHAAQRLIDPSEFIVDAWPMVVFASIGLVANIAAAIILRPQRHTSINMRGAYLEVLGDLLGSVAAIIAGLTIALTGFVQADAIASIIIALMIAPRAMILLRDSVRVLAQTVPHDLSVREIRTHLLEAEGVVDVHDVHVWSITSGRPVFSAHVVVEPSVFEESRTGPLLDELALCLEHHFDVEHSTFQLEPAEHARHEGHTHA